LNAVFGGVIVIRRSFSHLLQTLTNFAVFLKTSKKNNGTQFGMEEKENGTENAASLVGSSGKTLG
jgi:hypothetical protein